jgi:suppressor of ftsI
VHGANGSFIGAGDTLDIIRMRAPGDLAALIAYEHPEGTGAVPEIPDGVTTRAFRLEGHREINGKEMDMNRIDEVVPAGATEFWEVTSNSQPHTFHIHGATFHVLDVDGSEPVDWMRGPKDTVLVSPGHPVRLLVRFREHVDPAVPYMYYCHILRHEDIGMMGQFVVVEPGTEDAVDRFLDSDHDRH